MAMQNFKAYDVPAGIFACPSGNVRTLTTDATISINLKLYK